MSLWLCRQEPLKQPFYINEMDIYVYSSQELSYVIVQNPLFVMENFVTDELFAFIQEQLGMGFAALKMSKLRRSGEKEEEVLALFLQEAEYCTPGEITRFKQSAAAFRKMHPAEYRKARADYLMRAGQYSKAVALYDTILAMPRDVQVNDVYIAGIYYNRATAYARLFEFDQAVKSYEAGYHLGKNENVLKVLFFLQCLEPELEIDESCRSLMAPEKCLAWKEEYEQIMKELSEHEEQGTLEALFEKDPVRRKEGLQMILNGWKKKYRRMQSPA